MGLELFPGHTAHVLHAIEAARAAALASGPPSLSQILRNTAAQARHVMEVARAGGRQASVEHAAALADRLVPDIERSRSLIFDFAGSAIAEIKEALRRNDLDPARALFERLLGQLFELSLDARRLASDMGAARAAINGDMAQIQSELAHLQVVISARTLAATQADEKVREKALRTSLTWLGGPLVKLVDEIVSLVQDGTLTELALADAIRDLTQARADIERCESASGALSLLHDCAGVLGDGVQGLLNAMALTLGHLRNASDDLGQAAQLELFCHAAILDLESLRASAG